MSRLLVVAVAGEAGLAVVALVWIWWRELPVAVGAPLVGVLAGLGTAAVLALVNYTLLRLAPPIGPVRQIRALYRETLRPLFAGTRLVDVAGVSLAAGVGEELLFRGAMQTEWGLAVASVLFGLAHVGGRSSLMFGGWVVLMGVVLGGLAQLSGGLLAPVVAHAVYDAAAIGYIRRDQVESEV